LFDVLFGFLLVCTLTTVGSTLCYLLSEFFAREYVFYYVGQRITYLQRKLQLDSGILVHTCPLSSENSHNSLIFYMLKMRKLLNTMTLLRGNKINAGNCGLVDDNSHRLLAYLLFIRLFPILPSWLLNIVAPFLNIPLFIFALSAFIG
uniref:Autophagy-related protein 9 n=1 Tax=Gongylonema pulchrum TaxID=637853 RepID=A0A183DIK5_9BILA